MSAVVFPALALVLLAGAAVLAFAALLARSLFTTSIQLAGAGALIAALLALLGQGEGALATALLMVGWTPVMLLAAMLLSARVTGARRPAPWLSIAAAGASAAALAWAVLGADAHAPLPLARSLPGVSVWFAPLLFVVAVACVGLLGHGERGALGQAGEQ